jgi:serine/threonine protein kinase
MSQLASDFEGTQRFELRSRLGEGGMGVVYQAFDRERGTVVALKTLRDLDESLNADLVLRFKNEFRSLQDLQHPNLVSLGELIEDSGHWFFTMELLDGVDFIDWVRPGQPTNGEHTPTKRQPGAPATPATHPDHHVGFVGDAIAHVPTVPVAVTELPPLHEGRLREAMRQLAAGLSALHGAGKVHRDIKPNNILVQPDGRLVLLDFGLVTEATRENWADEGVVGTTAYMAPEQAASKPVGPEADCYAVGVLLYEALTGQLPFSGSTMKILMNKQREEAPSPRAVDAKVPADLDRLCRQLLDFKPALRPTAREILARLGGAAAVTPSPSGRSWSFSQSSLFVGRTAELAELRRAFADTLAGQTATLLIQGESGVGKTALARHFLGSVKALHADAVVLQARCYERESVPFKAFDGIVDALSQYMVSLSDADAAVLLPVNAALLATVFPVLRRVRVMAKAPRPRHDVLDPQQLRMRVFGAVRELLTRLADRRPLILVVDDFQWADADSMALLEELTRQPEGPGLLLVLIATVRAAAPERDDEDEHENIAVELGARRVRLSALGPVEARRLATILARRQGADPSLAEAIAADANGHPLFIDELVRHATSQGARPAPVHLDAALQDRIALLDPQERRLLELVAVAGGRLTQETAARASAMPPIEFDKRLASLRVAHMVMTKGERRSDAVEPYHDRVRRAVLASLDEQARREHHEQLALALEASGRADPEALATHWRGAGEVAHAAKYAGLAADRAARALAFDRAAAFYRVALELRSSHGDAQTRALQVKLAEALVNAGRGAEAAEVYLAAASGAVGGEELDLKRRAAEQLLRCGHIDVALDLYSTIQRALGVPLAPTPGRAIVSLLAQRVRIRLRGLRYTERDESQVTRRELSRIDTGFFVGLGLTTVDTVRGADVLARQLLQALDAGEPYRIARAVALQAAVNAAGVERSRPRAHRRARRHGDGDRAPHRSAARARPRLLGRGRLRVSRGPLSRRSSAQRSGAGHLSRALHRRGLGSGERAGLLAVVALLPRRMGRARPPPARAHQAGARSRRPLRLDQPAHVAHQLVVARRRRSGARGGRSGRRHPRMVTKRVSFAALLRAARARTMRPLHRRRRLGASAHPRPLAADEEQPALRSGDGEAGDALPARARRHRQRAAAATVGAGGAVGRGRRRRAQARRRPHALVVGVGGAGRGVRRGGGRTHRDRVQSLR